MIGYGSFYALITKLDRTDLSLIRSVAVCDIDANL